MKTSARNRSKGNLAALSLKLEQAEQLAKGMKEQVRRKKARAKAARKALKQARKEARHARKLAKEARKSWETASARALTTSKSKRGGKKPKAAARGKPRAKTAARKRPRPMPEKGLRGSLVNASAVSVKSEATPLTALSDPSSVTLG
jgi:hypothetical protein